MRRSSTGILAASGLSLVLAGCGSGGVVPTPTVDGQRSVLPSTMPVQAYSMVARQIKGCWFNPASPVLPGHIFRAEAGAGRESGSETKISIYESAPDGRLGLKAYTVAFEPRGKGTAVTTKNLRLDGPLGQKLTADVGYWLQGGPTCEGRPVPAGGPEPRGSFGGQPKRVSR